MTVTPLFRFSSTDLLSWQNTKITFLGGSDSESQILLAWFSSIVFSDPCFTFKLTSIFWVDPRLIPPYNLEPFHPVHLLSPPIFKRDSITSINPPSRLFQLA